MTAVLSIAKLFFGGFFRVLANVVDFARRNPWQAVVIALLIACVVLWRGKEHESSRANLAEADAAKWKQTFIDQRTEFRKLVGLMKEARKEAAKLDRENKERVGREMAAAIERVQTNAKNERNRALIALRERLRGDGGAGGDGVQCVGSSGTTRLPVLSTVPPGALLPSRPAVVDGNDAELCTLNTLNYEALIRAWRGVAAVDVNKSP